MKNTYESSSAFSESKANLYPCGTTAAVKAENIIKLDGELNFSGRLSSKMISCASVLPVNEYVGWQMSVPQKGSTSISLFGSEAISESDLKWIGEKQLKLKSTPVNCSRKGLNSLKEVFELYLPVNEISTSNGLGFGATIFEEKTDNTLSKWPTGYIPDFSQFADALKETGGIFRTVVASTSELERNDCSNRIHKTWQNGRISPTTYIGTPVKARYLLAFPQMPSIRFLSILNDYVPGCKIRHIGNINSEFVYNIWQNPLKDAAVYPDYAARIMMMEPVTFGNPVPGIILREEPAKPLSATHKNPKDKSAIVIGKAYDTSGAKKKITLSEIDLRRHYQIIGQTGTGKSTFIANMVSDAVSKGYGLTFFDPHGTTVDVILKALPKEYANRVRVVRIGDNKNFVPLNMWSCKNPTTETEEKTIADICELFGNIFNPKTGDIYVGPRYERWLTTFLNASLALFSSKASFETVSVLSANRSNIRKTFDKLNALGYTDLASIIENEYGRDESSDFTNCLNWYLCKLTRLTSCSQLRNTLGAGINALDFESTIDTNTVNLIDLASPTIGTVPAQIIGTFILMNLWNAVKQRKNKDKTHICIVDEASLFTYNPMPRLLAEGRKFGISMVLCHQHNGQLSSEVRDALEANSASFSSFRLSTKDAINTAIKLGDDKYGVLLPRLDAFNAITSISVDGKQSAPFTLMVEKPIIQKHADIQMKSIERKSRMDLIYSHSDQKALNRKEIYELLCGSATDLQNHKYKKSG